MIREIIGTRDVLFNPFCNAALGHQLRNPLELTLTGQTIAYVDLRCLLSRKVAPVNGSHRVSGRRKYVGNSI